MIVDTREQSELVFALRPPVTGIVHRALEVGDYAVEFEDGLVPPIRFERKSLGDLYGTMTSGYPRWKRLMQRAQAAKLDLWLLVEEPLRTVWAGTPHSTWSGDSMLAKLFTLQVRYRLPIIFCQDRGEMARWIVEYASAVGREWVVQQQRVQRKVR